VVLRNAARRSAVPALLAALLGGILTISDPGPDQIFGTFRAASQILASFSVRHDFELAGRQSLLLAACVLALSLPIALLSAPRIAAAVLPRQTRKPARARVRGVAIAATSFFSALAAAGTAAPLAGLALPLLEGSDFGRAFAVAARTLADTLIYAGGGGLAAVTFGFVAALLIARSERLRIFALAFSIASFTLPPALLALGALRFGAQAPWWTDWLLRSRFTVSLSLGLRCFPVALLFALRSWAAMPPSWALAAGLHGVPLGTYLVRVVLPHLAAAGAPAFLLAALLSAADLTTVLLLQPPGASSFTLAIFTVMANARESFAASLCIVYCGAAAAVPLIAWAAGKVRGAIRAGSGGGRGGAF
jgi:ABC-type Fe3+ transport system permease subunit